MARQANILNIIHLPHRTDREESFRKQCAEQGIIINVWDGIVVEKNIKAGVSQAHRQIVQAAKELDLPSVTIAEDDIQFTAPGAWQYYLDNFPEDYDIYLGMVYAAKLDENFRIKNGYSGNTLYTVHQRFYDFFLTAPDTDHLDRWLGNYAHQFKYYVCKEFVCYQSGGYSDNRKSICFYEELLRGKKLFGREIIP